jgi:MFS family permease
MLNLLLGLWNGGEMLVLSLYLQQVLHDSPLATGLAIAPQGVVGFTAGVFGARLASRIGIRRVLVLTGVIGAAGFAILTQLPATGHYSPLLAAVMLVGFGTAGTAFGTMVIATSGVNGAEQGVVGGVVNTSRQIGAATGAAVLPAISAAVSHNGGIATATGTRAAMLAGAIAALLATIIAWRSGRSLPRPSADRRVSTGWRDHPAERDTRPGRAVGRPRHLRLLAIGRRPGAGAGAHRRRRGERSHPAGRRPGRDAIRPGTARRSRRP